jgi:hypothetical protein
MENEMAKFIVSMDMVINAMNAEEAEETSNGIAEGLKLNGEIDYYLLAPTAKPVITPDD